MILCQARFFENNRNEKSIDPVARTKRRNLPGLRGQNFVFIFAYLTIIIFIQLLEFLKHVSVIVKFSNVFLLLLFLLLQ